MLKICTFFTCIISFITALKSCNILALSGGGSFGAVEVGIVDSLVSARKIPPIFDIVTGISAGGLNAAVLSYYNDIPAALPLMISMYLKLRTEDVYYSDMKNVWNRWSIYNNAPLEKTMRTLLEPLPTPKYPPQVLIGASNLYTYEMDIFTFNDMSFEDKMNVLMSTTAIPFVFPPRKFNETVYIDGGIISNEIIIQSIGFIDCAMYNITFISARARHNTTSHVSGFVSYASTVLDLVFHTFDSQLAQVLHCKYPKGEINACFPTDPTLTTYSVLDFNHGRELYISGKMNYKCERYDLC